MLQLALPVFIGVHPQPKMPSFPPPQYASQFRGYVTAKAPACYGVPSGPGLVTLAKSMRPFRAATGAERFCP